MELNIGIGKSQPIWDDLPAFTPPPITDIACLHGRRPAASEVVVMMRQDALLQIDVHGRSDTSVELGGLLLGNVYQHEDRLFVEIGAAIEAKSDRNGPVHFTFTADAWAAAHKERETYYPSLKIVGWFHTHPDLGVFYSGDDVVVHTTAFSLPWHVGLVLDPVRNTSALFGWVEERGSAQKTLSPIQGWYEMGDNQDGSVIPWRHRHQYGLSAMRRDAMRSSFSRYDGAAPEVQEPLPLVTDGELTFITMFLALVALVFTFLVYFPMVERRQQMADITANLAQAQVIEWNSEKALFCSTDNVYIVAPAPGQSIETGRRVKLVGRAEAAGINRYLVQVLLPESGWTTFSGASSDGVETLATWDTSDLPAGEYHLRLLGVNSIGQQLPDLSCITSYQLVDPPERQPVEVESVDGPVVPDSNAAPIDPENSEEVIDKTDEADN